MKVKLAEDLFFQQIILSLFKISNKSFIGEFKSAFKGIGLDFYQNRVFSENDSIRLINWNIFAKLRTLYVKEYIEDRNRFNLIVLDISSSMFQKFEKRSKIEIGLEVALVLLYSSLKTNDNTAFILFDNKIRYFFPFDRKFNYFFKIFDTLKNTYIEIKPSENLQEIFKNLYNLLKKRTQIFFISDFAFNVKSELLSFLTSKHNLTSIFIIDKEEERLSQNLNFYSSIEFPSIFIQTPYHTLLYENINMMKKNDIDTILINTEDKPFLILQKFFENKITKY